MAFLRLPYSVAYRVERDRLAMGASRHMPHCLLRFDIIIRFVIYVQMRGYLRRHQNMWLGGVLLYSNLVEVHDSARCTQVAETMQAREFSISNHELRNLKGQIIIITGGAAGIGLATSKILLEQGCTVIVGDLNPPAISFEGVVFHRTNVALWEDLRSLFKTAYARYGRIDHVFANAGISETAGSTYLKEEFGTDGELEEPDHSITDLNVTGTANTCFLALHYMRRQPTGGSMVVTSSITGFQVFRSTQYTMSKHAVLGFMRGLVPNLKALDHEATIRINAITPSWTLTGLLSQEAADTIGIPAQEPEAVALAAVLLMADQSRQGQVIYIGSGKYKEIEHSILSPAVEDIIVSGEERADTYMERLAQKLAADKDG
ncbi:NAD(P)-binding protein [Polychaeton citri CBS 116435]|uniref:NAD(P)-binding protein n=1 Tax=Polychaeton citri CBS 116435 TaxID=1314669 RepID=A0A9P4UU69_9PEZI|nr:NAD(P)-binding protein [Polychaeton citri CBS 116435]